MHFFSCYLEVIVNGVWSLFYSKWGWELGKLNYAHNQPEHGLEFFGRNDCIFENISSQGKLNFFEDLISKKIQFA